MKIASPGVVSSFLRFASPPSSQNRNNRPTDRPRGGARAGARSASYLQPHDRSSIVDPPTAPPFPRTTAHDARTITTTHPSNPRARRHDANTHGRRRVNETNETNARSVVDRKPPGGWTRVASGASNESSTREPRARARRRRRHRHPTSIYTYRRSRQRRAGAERRRTVRHHDAMG